MRAKQYLIMKDVSQRLIVNQLFLQMIQGTQMIQEILQQRIIVNHLMRNFVVYSHFFSNNYIIYSPCIEYNVRAF